MFSSEIQESVLYQCWINYARSGRTVNFSGRRLRIISAGRLNMARGPDFTASRFELDGCLYQGDVELHVRAEDWYRHQHHLDRIYSGVILHVVAVPGKCGNDSVRHAHRAEEIPTIRLPIPETCDIRRHPANSCRAKSGFEKNFIKNFEKLATGYFQLKVRQMSTALDQSHAGQVFYRCFLRALGYPHNSAAFQMLAERLDWQWIKNWFLKIWGTPAHLYALYAGQAAFIPYQPADAFGKQLAHLYGANRALLKQASLPAEIWQFSATRPCNHPHFRLAGWVNLLYARHGDLFGIIERLVMQRAPHGQLYRALTDCLRQPTDNYWKTHYAIGCRIKGDWQRHFFGKGRINEFISNIIVPLFAARALRDESDGFYEYLQQFFLYLPAAGGYQSVLKNMPWAVPWQKRYNRHAFNLAVLSLNQNYCLANGCRHCPAGRINSQ